MAEKVGTTNDIFGGPPGSRRSARCTGRASVARDSRQVTGLPRCSGPAYHHSVLSPAIEVDVARLRFAITTRYGVEAVLTRGSDLGVRAFRSSALAARRVSHTTPRTPRSRRIHHERFPFLFGPVVRLAGRTERLRRALHRVRARPSRPGRRERLRQVGPAQTARRP